MKVSDSMIFMWLWQRLRLLQAGGYDPYNSVGPLKIGRSGISFSWRA